MPKKDVTETNSQISPFFKFAEMERKNIRDTAVWQRTGALNCLERTNAITNYRIGAFLIVSGTAISNGFGMALIVAGMAVLVEVIRQRNGDGTKFRPPLVAKNVTFGTFAGGLSREILGFRHEDLEHLHAALDWPDDMLCNGLVQRLLC